MWVDVRRLIVHRGAADLRGGVHGAVHVELWCGGVGCYAAEQEQGEGNDAGDGEPLEQGVVGEHVGAFLGVTELIR